MNASPETEPDTPDERVAAVPRRRGRKTKGKAGVEAALDATKLLLKTSPPGTLTQQAVASAAGFDDRMIRYYFGDIDGLLDRVVVSLLDDFDQAMDVASQPGPPAMERVRARLEAVLRFAQDQPSFLRMVIERLYDSADPGAVAKRQGFNEKALTRLHAVVRDGQAEGSIRPDLDVDMFYMAALGLCEVFVSGQPILGVLFPNADADELAERYLDFAFDLVKRGIGVTGATGGSRRAAHRKSSNGGG